MTYGNATDSTREFLSAQTPRSTASASPNVTAVTTIEAAMPPANSLVRFAVTTLPL